ncbi:MAG: quinoprotein dehydrogenase-associated SoxYZ-like carrier [Pseudomonadota bacterium]
MLNRSNSTRTSVTTRPDSHALLTGLTLIVDENPAPVAAVFAIHEGGDDVVDISTRVRVNAYSNVRVIAEMDDGSLYQTARFVKATGGCAAPASKDAAAALAAIGKMRLRRFEASALASERREAQVMIRHPNNSGFQVDQITQLYIPAFFIDHVEVRQGDTPLFTVDGGISLSEDPSIRFSYVPNGATEFAVHASDTEGGEYSRSFPVAEGS